MPTLLLVRHGETEWNRTGQIMGERPIPLTEAGERQTRELAAVIDGCSIQAIYSSPVKRARQTADILASAANAPILEVPGLTEINMGDWVGQFWKDLADDLVPRNYYAHPKDARPPGGETLQEVQARAVACTEQAIAGRPAGHEGRNQLMFVSHADVLRTIVAHYLRLDLQTIRQVRIDHASLTGLDVDGSLTSLLFLNCRAEPPGLK